MTDNQHTYAVIMCGGLGSRFWPFSRTARPKQFLDLLGTGRTLLQSTVERLEGLIPPGRIFPVTNREYRSLVAEQLPSVPPENILCEPARRNTAPCLCWAAAHIHALDPQAVVATLPADHLILREVEFRSTLALALDFAAANPALLTLGIRPTNPNTGYGYIQVGESLPQEPRIHRVRCFTEKPDPDMARAMLASGDFLWNAGIFVYSAAHMLRCFRELAPEIYEAFDAPPGTWLTPAEEPFIADAFGRAPAISVDYAIMEKAPGVYTIPADLAWSDLGSWNTLYETLPHDPAGNATLPGTRTLATDCSGTLLATTVPGKAIVATGLRDCIVADTPGALLIMPRAAEPHMRRTVTRIATDLGADLL